MESHLTTLLEVYQNHQILLHNKRKAPERYQWDEQELIDNLDLLYDHMYQEIPGAFMLYISMVSYEASIVTAAMRKKYQKPTLWQRAITGIKNLHKRAFKPL